MSTQRRNDTSIRILEAARSCLLDDGYAGLTTRRVADRAGVPLSQIHYHFRSKRGVVLALLAHENQRLVERQREMYGAESPLWKRYDQACDFLEDDLASGYVRVLQEMIAAGWSDRVVAEQVLALLKEWFDILAAVVREAEVRFGKLEPFSSSEIAGLIGMSFLGGETVILLGDEQWGQQVRTWLRRVGDFIRQVEEGSGARRR